MLGGYDSPIQRNHDDTFTDVIQIASGSKHAVVLQRNRTVQCWGDDLLNQCDPIHRTFTNIMTPHCVVLW